MNSSLADYDMNDSKGKFATALWNAVMGVSLLPLTSEYLIHIGSFFQPTELNIICNLAKFTNADKGFQSVTKRITENYFSYDVILFQSNFQLL